MINLKIVLLGYYIPSIFFLLAQENEILVVDYLTAYEMIGACMAVSFLCGWASSQKPNEKINWSIVLKSAFMSSMFGLVTGIGSVVFIIDRPVWSYIVIAISGGISLGGLAAWDRIQRKGMNKTLDKMDKYNE